LKVINGFRYVKVKAKKIYKKYKMYILGTVFLIALCLVYVFSKSSESHRRVFRPKHGVGLEGGRILNGSKSIYERKEQIISKRLRLIEKSQKTINEKLDILQREIKNIEVQKKEERREEKAGRQKDEAKPIHSDRPDEQDVKTSRTQEDDNQIYPVVATQKRR